MSETTPRLSSLESKMEQLQSGYDEIDKSMGYHIEDVTANKTKIEKLNWIIGEQQKAIERLICDNRKTLKKIGNLQDLVTEKIQPHF